MTAWVQPDMPIRTIEDGQHVGICQAVAAMVANIGITFRLRVRVQPLNNDTLKGLMLCGSSVQPTVMFGDGGAFVKIGVPVNCGPLVAISWRDWPLVRPLVVYIVYVVPLADDCSASFNRSSGINVCYLPSKFEVSTHFFLTFPYDINDINDINDQSPC